MRASSRMRISLISAALFLFGSSILAQTAAHTVTVQVSTITALQVSSGTVNLNINGANAIAGQNTMTTTSASTSLLWGTNSSQKKITVRTSLGTQKFALKILALNPTQGLAASEVTLATTARDFMLNVGRSSGNCLLQYTGVALASQGTGTDAHTITFTVATQ